jgi:Leucine rich repeat
LTCSSVPYVSYRYYSNFLSACDIKKVVVTDKNTTIESLEVLSKSVHFDEIRAIEFQSCFMYYLPRGLEKFKPDLMILFVLYSHMREIHQADLKVFPALESLSLNGNKIQVLEADLFKFNTKLRIFSIFHNHIRHVDPSIFSHLQSMVFIRFEFNPCTYGMPLDATTSEEVMQKVSARCPMRRDGSVTWDPREEFEDLRVVPSVDCDCLSYIYATVGIVGFLLVMLGVDLFLICQDNGRDFVEFCRTFRWRFWK